MAGGGAVPIFLHLTHFVLAVVTIVCLHWSGYLYDLDKSMDRQKAVDDSNKVVEKNNKQFGLKQEKQKDADFYCTGAIWGIVAGLLGLVALVIFVLSFVFRLPKAIQWYYLVAAILILFFASLGMGLSANVKNYDDCLNPTTLKPGALPSFSQQELQLQELQLQAKELAQQNAHSGFGGEGRKGDEKITAKPITAKDCVKSYHGGAGTFIIFIFVLSVAHSLAYAAAFLLTFFGDSSSSGVSNDQQARDQAARDQQIRDQQAQQRMSAPDSATNSAAPDVEAAKG